MAVALEPLMPSAAIKSRYSSKRKADIVTGAAIALFLMLAAFQLFLIFVLPIMLQHRNLWEFQVAKDEVIRQVDGLRGFIRFTPTHGSVQSGELTTVKGVVDQLASYTRENMDTMDWSQLALLKRTLGQFMAVQHRWVEEPPRFYIVEKKVQMPLLLNCVEKDIVE